MTKDGNGAIEPVGDFTSGRAVARGRHSPCTFTPLNDVARMGSLRLRRTVTASSGTATALPAGLVMRRFVPASHARAARALLNASYASGVGQVEPFEEWWPALQADTEYDPELCFLAGTVEDDTVAAFAQCWTSGFVKDFAVAPAYRRRGLGRALMNEISNCFAKRGCKQLDLKVVSENIEAIRFYRSLGFHPVADA